MKKKLLTWLMAIVLIMGIPMTASAAFNTETRESVAVVYTCLDMDGGEYGFSWGTGFFIGKQGEDPKYLITNYHVISDFESYGAGEVIDVDINGSTMRGRSKVRVYYDSKDYEEAYVVDFNESKDIALLKLSGTTDKRKPVVLCSPDDSMVGTDVYAVGYPSLSENVFAGSTTHWGLSDASVTKGIFSRIFTTQGTGRVNIQVDCDIKHGNSGGPLVNDEGMVIGINTWGVSNEGGESVNYAVSIDEIIPLLNQYNVSYAKSNPGTEIVKQEEEVKDDTEESVNEVVVETVGKKEEPKSNMGMWIPIAVAAIVGVIIIVVVVIMRGSKNDEEQKPQEYVPQPSVKHPVIRSLSAQHRGMRVEINNQPILIGRSKSDCSIVFAENTPGVSGRHCSVAWDAASSNFVLTDLGSTYGTYLQGGQKLNPGVPYNLKAGESFYLGEINNMLSVNLE